jgi:hypothetical protein
MALLKARRRLVTFRVTDEEYERLRVICSAKAFRSVSEFARDAVLHRIELSSRPAMSLGDDLATLGMHLGELNDALKELSGRISRVLGGKSRGKDSALED